VVVRFQRRDRRAFYRRLDQLLGDFLGGFLAPSGLGSAPPFSVPPFSASPSRLRQRPPRRPRRRPRRRSPSPVALAIFSCRFDRTG